MTMTLGLVETPTEMSSKPDDAHQSSTSVNNLQTQVSSLQFELSELQRRYDALLEAKERAAARYKLDYKKWRDFKRLMYADDKEDRARRPLDAHKDSRVHGKRKRFEEMGPNVDAFEDEEDEDSMELEKPVDNDAVSLARNILAGHARRKSLPSQSSALCIRKSFEFTTESHSTPNTPATSARTRDPLQTKISNGNTSFPTYIKLSSPHAIKLEDPVEDLSTSVKQQKMSESNITPLEDNSPRLNDYKRYKGRGRYARVSTCEDPDTNRPVSREDENHEPNYDRYETVRNKEQRKQLLGDDCECCRDYYAGVGPLPPRLQQPMWRSPSPNSIPTTKPLCKHRQTDTYATNVGASGSMEQVQEEEITRHKQAISRHRHHWYRPKTPPGYWDIGFPDTQEASDINRRARDMIRQKMHGISRDAG